MLGRVELTTDVAVGAAVAFTKVAGAEMLFHVEEAEMLVDLSARVPLSQDNAAAQNLFATFFVASNGAAAADISTGGLGLDMANAAQNITAVLKPRRVVRLDKGTHVIDVRVKVAAGAITAQADVVALELVAQRHSHPGTLGHGVESKAQLIQ